MDLQQTVNTAQSQRRCMGHRDTNRTTTCRLLNEPRTILITSLLCQITTPNSDDPSLTRFTSPSQGSTRTFIELTVNSCNKAAAVLGLRRSA